MSFQRARSGPLSASPFSVAAPDATFSALQASVASLSLER
jgi:hypothetical protein